MSQVLGCATNQRHTWNWKITCKTRRKKSVLLRLRNHKNRLEFYKKYDRQPYISSRVNVWRVEENYHSLNAVRLLIVKTQGGKKLVNNFLPSCKTATTHWLWSVSDVNDIYSTENI
jgi:hypothetical protein